ncbi:MAG TPA: EAL domain-containing protein [Candidatus Saccharimonadales bacterium]|nr:EAL domain-containing protein [Candidatus Saccharimonadales bacterium]
MTTNPIRVNDSVDEAERGKRDGTPRTTRGLDVQRVARGRRGAPDKPAVAGLARVLLDQAPAALAVVGEGSCDVSPALRALLADRADGAATDVVDLLVEEEREGARGLLRAAMTGERPTASLESFGLGADGRRFRVRVTASHVGGADVPLPLVRVEDLSGEARPDEALRRATERLTIIVDNAPLAIVSFDLAGNVQTWNPAAERLFGWSAEAIVGRPLPAGAGLVSGGAITELVTGGGRLEGVDMLGESSDGTLRDCAIWAAPLRDAGDRVVGAVALLDDVTERNHLQRDLQSALDRQQTLETKLSFQASHDPLTGLGNRRLFMERATAAMAAGRDSALLVLDLDDFKTVNDRHGHQAGDALLVGVAQRLRACLRGDDLAGRLGGDEFGVLLEDCPTGDLAVEVAARILRSLEEPFELVGRLLFAHASIGIALRGAEWRDVVDLFAEADIAMYLAKSEGKGRAELYQPTMHADIIRRIGLRADLEEAIQARQFSLLYQPIYAIDDGHLQGVEALVRWDHPTRGVLLPAEFLDLANETGLIVPLGRWIVGDACRQMAAWRAAWPSAASMDLAVNISAVQLRHPAFAEDFRAALSESGLPAADLVLEVTQGVLSDSGVIIRTLEELKSMGVRIALDNFGASYSPLSHVGRYPVDIVKIDRSFIAALGTQTGEATVASAIVELAGNLNLKTVAEGIETPAQLGLLRAMGCQMGQGYYLARPLSVMQVEALIRELAAKAAPLLQ